MELWQLSWGYVGASVCLESHWLRAARHRKILLTLVYAVSWIGIRGDLGLEKLFSNLGLKESGTRRGPPSYK